MAANVGSASIRITPDFAGFNKDFGNHLKNNFGNFASRQLAATGLDLSNAITKPIMGAFVDGLKIASNFYTTIGELSAVAGQNVGKFGSAIVTLESDGKKMTTSFTAGLREIARESKFSVDEMGQAATSLARMGVHNQQNIIDTLSVTNKVAAANREEIVKTTESMGTFANVFNMSKTEENMSHIGDVITKVLTTSNQDLTTFTEGMKRAAPVANTLGISFEDTASSLAVLGNVGFKGSTASTALKNAMVRLDSELPNVTETLAKYRIETKDSEGKSLSLVDVLKQMNSAGMTTADTFKLFGQVAGPSMAALMAPENLNAIERMSHEMSTLDGITDKMYERMKQTPEFKIEALMSNIEELKLSFVENLMPAFTNAVDGANFAVTGFINVWQGLPGGLKIGLQGVLVLTAAIGPLMVVLGKAGQAAGIFTSAFKNLIMGRSVGNIFLRMADGVDAISLKLIQSNAHATKLGGALTKGANGLSSMLNTIGSSTPILMAITATIAALTFAFVQAQKSSQGMKQASEEMSKSLIENYSVAVEERKSLTDIIKDQITDESTAMGKILSSDDYKTYMKDSGKNYKDLAKTLAGDQRKAVEELYKLGTDTADATDSWMENTGDFFAGTEFVPSDDTIDSIDRYNEMWGGYLTELKTNGGAYQKELDQIFKNADKAALTAGDAAKEYTIVPGLWSEEYSKAIDNGGKEIKKINDSEAILMETGNISDAFKVKFVNDELDKLKVVYTEKLGIIKSVVTKDVSAIKASSAALTQAEIAQDELLKDSLKGLVDLQNQVYQTNPMTSIIEGAGESSAWLLQTMNAMIMGGQDLSQNLGAITKFAGVDVETAISAANAKLQQMEGYIDRLKSSIPTLGGVMSTFAEDETPTLSAALDKLTNKFKETAEARQKMADLITINGGEFSSVYEQLAGMDQESLTGLLKNVDFNNPETQTWLRDQQNTLMGAMSDLGAASVNEIAAAAAANEGAGVQFIDPIRKAMNGLADDINNTSLTPTVSPKINPTFYTTWNNLVSAIRNVDAITAPAKPTTTGWATGGINGIKLGPGIPRALGGPVLPGMRYRVNERGREGFLGPGGLSWLPHRSSMQFSQPGVVVPANRMNGGNGISLTNNNYISGTSIQEITQYQSALEQAQLNRLNT